MSKDMDNFETWNKGGRLNEIFLRNKDHFETWDKF